MYRTLRFAFVKRIIVLTMFIPLLCACDSIEPEYKEQRKLLIGSAWDYNFISHCTIIDWQLIFYPDRSGKYIEDIIDYYDDYKSEVYGTKITVAYFHYKFTSDNELRIIVNKIESSKDKDNSFQHNSIVLTDKSVKESVWKYHVNSYEDYDGSFSRDAKFEFVEGDRSWFSSLGDSGWWIYRPELLKK